MAALLPRFPPGRGGTDHTNAAGAPEGRRTKADTGDGGRVTAALRECERSCPKLVPGCGCSRCELKRSWRREQGRKRSSQGLAKAWRLRGLCFVPVTIFVPCTGTNLHLGNVDSRCPRAPKLPKSCFFFVFFFIFTKNILYKCRVDVVLRMPSEPSNLSSVTTYELRRLEPSTPRPQMLALEVRRFQGLAPHAGRTHAGGSEPHAA